MAFGWQKKETMTPRDLHEGRSVASFWRRSRLERPGRLRVLQFRHCFACRCGLGVSLGHAQCEIGQKPVAHLGRISPRLLMNIGHVYDHVPLFSTILPCSRNILASFECLTVASLKEDRLLLDMPSITRSLFNEIFSISEN
jgi:hypothetical protein